MSSWALAGTTGTIVNPVPGVLVSTGVQSDNVLQFTVVIGATVAGVQVAFEHLDQSGVPYPRDAPMFTLPPDFLVTLPMRIHFARGDLFRLRLINAVTGIIFAALRFND